MIGCVWMVLAAAPVLFSTAARDADRIVVGRVVEVQHGGAPISVVEVQHVLRGPSGPTLRVAAALDVGHRSLLLLKGERLLAELHIQKRYPGEFVFLTSRVRFDGVLKQSVHELPYPSAIPVGAVLRSLKAELAELSPLPPGARVVETSCPPCEFEAVLRRARPAGIVDCGSVDDGGLDCVEAQWWSRRRPVVLRAPWTGVDSVGEVALVGTRSIATVYQLDEDVTGGGNWACSRAVFVHECRDPQLGKPLFGCLGKTAVACSERDAMNQRLGPLVPVEALDAGEIRFHGDGGSMTCFLRLDRSLACD